MKTKKSVEVVKDSPSSLAFSSPTKRKLLSDLTTARANVKNKFKKAYMERMRREREMDKIFKLITKKIAALTSRKKKGKSSSETNGKTSDDGKDNDQSYFDDTLHDSAFESSQFKAGKSSKYDGETTPLSLILSPQSRRGRTPTSNRSWGRTPTASQLWGPHWRTSAYQDLLRQTKIPTSSYSPTPATTTTTWPKALTREQVLGSHTPNMLLMEPSSSSAFPHQTPQKLEKKKNKPDRRALEVNRLDSNLKNITQTPTSSRFRNVDKRGQFRETYGESLESFCPVHAQRSHRVRIFRRSERAMRTVAVADGIAGGRQHESRTRDQLHSGRAARARTHPLSSSRLLCTHALTRRLTVTQSHTRTATSTEKCARCGCVRVWESDIFIHRFLFSSFQLSVYR